MLFSLPFSAVHSQDPLPVHMTSTNFGISECRDHDLLQQHGEVWFQAAIQIAVTEYHAKKAVSHISKELSMGVVKAIK